MLSDFPDPAQLPGGWKTGLTSDTTTYYNIWKVAEGLNQNCIESQGKVGWQLTGEISVIHSPEFLASILSRSLSYMCCYASVPEFTADILILVFESAKAHIRALEYSSGLQVLKKID